MKEWAENKNVQELLAMRKQVLALSTDECKKESEIWIALIEGRVLKIFENHPERDVLAKEIEKIEFDPITEWAWVNGEYEPISSRANELHYNVHDTLASEFRYKLSKVLLSCVTSLVSESSELPQYITPSIDLSFVREKSSNNLLQVRWDEAYRCRKMDLEMSGVVMLVSFLEGLLGISFEKHLTREEVEKFGSTKDYQGNKIILPVERWTLDMLFAAGKKVLDLRKEFWTILRLSQSLRNEIHPMKAKTKQKKVTTDDLDLVWVAAQLLVPTVKRFSIDRTSA